MMIRKAHCLFEQSGVFKNEFIKLGIPAEDYDILNDFEQTDNVVDLFYSIESAYKGEPSIFDDFNKDDIVLAFFPCTRFEAQISLYFRGVSSGQKNWSDIQRLEYSMKIHKELAHLYDLICKLFIVCLRGGWRLIVENPKSQPHYLNLYFPIEPSIVDMDRRDNGDKFKKPTQYWFVNCKPQCNFVTDPIEQVEFQQVISVKKGNCKSRQVAKSMIEPIYARRFIKQYILTGEDR